MNNNDLAALAALGAMGYMYKNHLDKQGAGQGTPAAGYEDVVPGSELGSQGNFRFGTDTPTDAGAAIARDNRDLAGAQRGNSGVGLRLRGGNEQRYRDNRGGGGGGKGGTGYEDVVSGSELGSQGNFRFSTPDVAPGESNSGAGLAAAGAGAAGLGGAAYWANKRLQERAIEKARAERVAETKRGILADRAQAGVNEDRAAAAREQNEADRAARAQAEAEAEAKSRATQAEIDAELKKYKQKAANAKNDRVPLRSQVMNKDAWLEGPSTSKKITTLGNTTVSEPSVAATTAPRENAARMTAAQKAAAKQAADMEAFNSMLREQKVGPAVEEGKRVKARGAAGKVGLGLAALGLGSAASAATDMTAGQRERLGKDVLTSFALPLSATTDEVGAGSDFGFSNKPLSSSEKKKLVEAMSPADRKKMEEALARQGQDSFTFQDFKNFITSKKAGGGQIKAKKMASGGMTSKVSSASKRGDGIASKGKTRCKLY